MISLNNMTSTWKVEIPLELTLGPFLISLTHAWISEITPHTFSGTMLISNL